MRKTAMDRVAIVADNRCGNAMRQLLPLLLVLGCATNKDKLTLIERESLTFKAENERIRADDLEARYYAGRAKADRLAAEVLQLGVERDRLYDEYDRARAELATLHRKRDSVRKEQASLAGDIQKIEKENGERLDAKAASF